MDEEDVLDQTFSIPSGVTTEESGRKGNCYKSMSHSNMSGEPCDLDNSPLIVESVGDMSQRSYNHSSKEN